MAMRLKLVGDCKWLENMATGSATPERELSDGRSHPLPLSSGKGSSLLFYRIIKIQFALPLTINYPTLLLYFNIFIFCLRYFLSFPTHFIFSHQAVHLI